MAFFTWNDSYKVGVKMMDDDHKKLVDMINALHDAMTQGKGREALAKVLQELVAYTDYHFRNEESLMRTHVYAQYTQHKEVHDNLRKKAGEMLAAAQQSGSNISLQVMEFLKGWLTHHIGERDRLLADFLREKGIK